MKEIITVLLLFLCCLYIKDAKGSESETQSCGIKKLTTSDAITYGQTIHPYSWPWISPLFTKTKLGINFKCGAVLVSRFIVVTAAHCVVSESETSLLIYLGRHNLFSWGEYDDSQVRTISRKIIHPEYKAGPHDYVGDLAILVLSKPAEMNLKVQPICLLDEDEVITKPGTLVTVVGWGKNENDRLLPEPMLATLPIVTREECIKSYPPLNVTNKVFCAGFRNDTGPCHGDSGSGMYSQAQNGRWMLQGIHKASAFNDSTLLCNNKQYAMVTDMAKYTPWLKRYIQRYDSLSPDSDDELPKSTSYQITQIALECSANLPEIKQQYEERISCLQQLITYENDSITPEQLKMALRSQEASLLRKMTYQIKKITKSQDIITKKLTNIENDALRK